MPDFTLSRSGLTPVEKFAADCSLEEEDNRAHTAFALPNVGFYCQGEKKAQKRPVGGVTNQDAAHQIVNRSEQGAFRRQLKTSDLAVAT